MDALNKVIIIFALILISTAIYGITKITDKEIKQCLSNPLTYGLQRVGNSNSCICNLGSQREFYISNTKIWRENKSSLIEDIYNYNFTNISIH